MASDNDEEIAIMGDVTNVCFTVFVLSVRPWVTVSDVYRCQINAKPAFVGGEDRGSQRAATAFVRGSVIGTDEGSDSFYVAPTQYCLALGFEAPFIVKAIIATPETANLPYQHLPHLNEDITFIGEIALFERGCVVVLVSAHTPYRLTDGMEETGDGGQW